MEISSPPIELDASYVRVGPLIFNEHILHVVESGVVLGSVRRASMKTIRIEPRTSFKHPVVGTVLGLLGVAGPQLPRAASFLGVKAWEWIESLRIVGFFMLVVGIILLIGVLRRRNIPWVVIDTQNGERCFPLEKEVTPDVEQLVQDLNTVHSAQSNIGARPNLN